MGEKITFSNHIEKASDLVTTQAETRAGFISLALEKNYIAVPYVEEAKALKALASKAKSPYDLLEYSSIRPGLLTASGLSDKAMGYLDEDDYTKAILGLIENFLEPAGDDFINELVYRYLLIKGDALGGKARNLAGTLGERKFIRSLLSVLTLTGTQYYWLNNESCTWTKQPENDAGIERHLKGLYWKIENKERVLLLNMNVPVVAKNVDLCLLDGHMGMAHLKGKESLHRKSENYIALGEIKGGIDPAGADEHWKTAYSALIRIRQGFQKKNLTPKTLFVGAAIANSMAMEIYDQLVDGILDNAANLSDENQLASINEWFINL